jgi:hypothetical protein
VSNGGAGPAGGVGDADWLDRELAIGMILAGSGGDIGILRQPYGCRPGAMIEVEASGLKWESSYTGPEVAVLAGTAIWLQADSAGAGRRGSSAMRRRVSGDQEQAVASCPPGNLSPLPRLSPGSRKYG